MPSEPCAINICWQVAPVFHVLWNVTPAMIVDLWATANSGAPMPE